MGCCCVYLTALQCSPTEPSSFITDPITRHTIPYQSALTFPNTRQYSILKWKDVIIGMDSGHTFHSRQLFHIQSTQVPYQNIREKLFDIRPFTPGTLATSQLRMSSLVLSDSESKKIKTVHPDTRRKSKLKPPLNATASPFLSLSVPPSHSTSSFLPWDFCRLHLPL